MTTPTTPSSLPSRPAGSSDPIVDRPGTHAPTPNDDLYHRETRFGEDFKRQYPITWWSTLIGPFLIAAGVITTIIVIKGEAFALKLLGAALAAFFGLGRFVILFGSDQKPDSVADAAEYASETARKFSFMTSGELFTMVTFMDLFAATLLVFHAGFLFKIPKLGPALLKLREEGEFFMRVQPWMRRFSFIGLAAFVMFPIAATGSVAGALFGQLLGMSRTSVMLAIIVGTLLGNGSMFYLGKAIRKIPFFDPNNPLSLIVGLGVVILIIICMGLYYSRLKKKYADQRIT
ncbi:MAG: small multi-drug export protein [Planctomycetes bacterium]|nr:small multi-drug export protein [Planctomycetota bacterium]